MTTFKRIAVGSLCLALILTAVLPPLLKGANAQTQPAAANPANLVKAINANDDQIKTLMPTLAVLANPDFRSGAGQKVLPLLQKSISLLSDLEKMIQQDARLKDSADLIAEVRDARLNAMTFASALGDKENTTALEALAKGKGGPGIAASASLSLAQWILNSKDAAAQQKILDDLTPLAKANAANEDVLNTLAIMINLGPANRDLEKNIIEIIRTNMKGPMTTKLLARLDAEQDQKALVGSPLAFSGRTSTGGRFSTADYKGKVILVDFWATWCPPCVAMLPTVKKTYAAYHEKGLEIVGISYDASEDDLNTFIREKGMTWVQLHEASQNENDNVHPLGLKYHVMAIPRMFLIDRKGILRHVNADDDLDKKIELLLAEKDQPATPK